MTTAKRGFHSPLARHLRAYLDFKQALGYTSFVNSHAAWDLDHFLLFRGVASIRELDEVLVANWMHAIPSNAAATKNGKLRFARGFLSYLVRLDLLKDNPARRIPYLRQKTYQPYIYSLREIDRIMAAARGNQCRYPNRLTGWTMETMVFLLYACGLRLGEAINLKIEDIDFEEGTLSLWRTKFHKERLVPFSPAVADKLRAYLARRNKYYRAGPKEPLFRSPRGRYGKGTIPARFKHLLARCGLAKPSGRGGPRLHDLRHAFAVHRLYKWYQEGHDIHNKLPLLSVYMGHVNIENTQVYLTITQALLREGDRRFQKGFEIVADKALHRAVGKP
ncbi:MAG: tyrosine-type recombinase/integrase [Elusimicrobiota bacterium]